VARFFEPSKPHLSKISHTMSNTIRNIGLIALAAAIFYKPAKRMIFAARDARDGGDAGHFGEDDGVLRKSFANAYRGKHKPHHRHANGHTHIHED